MLLAAALSAREDVSCMRILDVPTAYSRLLVILTEQNQSRAHPSIESFPLLLGPSNLELNAIPEEAMLSWLNEADRTARWLGSLVEHRSPSEIRRVRRLRMLAVASISLALLVAVLVYAMYEPNVALDKEVTASPLGFGTLPVGAVDGNKDGTFGFHTNGEDEGWMQIDLQRTYDLSKVKVFGRGDCCFDQSIPLALSISSDGKAFTEVGERDAPFSEAAPWIIPLPHTPARYVKLHRLGTGYLVVSEVEVFGRRARK